LCSIFIASSLEVSSYHKNQNGCIDYHYKLFYDYGWAYSYLLKAIIPNSKTPKERKETQFPTGKQPGSLIYLGWWLILTLKFPVIGKERNLPKIGTD